MTKSSRRRYEKLFGPERIRLGAVVHVDFKDGGSKVLYYLGRRPGLVRVQEMTGGRVSSISSDIIHAIALA